ncbi:SctD/MshK family protein [Agaricicola taiwanensis]|nr:FHA domain-containing protein [Agaricicola taiwanensis]
MNRILTWLSPDTGDSSPTLDIVSGLHRGTSIDLKGKSYRIGSAPDSDIILRDEGVAADHARIRIDGNAVHVETQSHEVELGNGLVLTAQQGARLRLPITMSIGQAQLRLSRDGASEPTIGQMASRLAVPVAAAILIPALLIVGIASRPDVESAAVSPRTAEVQRLSAESAPDNISNTVQAEETIVPNLQKRIQTAGLEGIKLAPSGNDIVATGSIAPDKHGVWIDVMTWFDRSYGGKASLVSMVETNRRPARPPVSVQAVWYGNNPYMIASDGKRYYEGASLNSGWSVRSIAKDRIILAKGSEEFRLTY